MLIALPLILTELLVSLLDDIELIILHDAYRLKSNYYKKCVKDSNRTHPSRQMEKL